MAVALAGPVPVSFKPAGARPADGASGADGDAHAGSFAAALSASTATPQQDTAGTAGAFDPLGGDDAADVADAPDAADADASVSAAPMAIADGSAPAAASVQQMPEALPMPDGHALLLAQGALAGVAAPPSGARASTTTAAAGPLPARVPTGRVASPSESPPVPAEGNAGTGATVAARAGGVAGAVIADTPESTAPARAATGATAATAAVGPAVEADAAVPKAVMAASTATPAMAPPTASAASAGSPQTQRAALQAAADRAVQQPPTTDAAAAPRGRAPEALAAAGLSGGASAESWGSGSPLLRRFERVLSMTHPAAGELQSMAGGLPTASGFLAPADAAGTAANTPGAPGAFADRATDATNGWLAQVVAQKNHNASLTVDVGGRPVSVDVQVQGNEAQVVFRADQPETRALLAQALPQLRQMMGDEGVVLSDASVAGQWSGNAGGSGASGGSNGTAAGQAAPAMARSTSPAHIDAGGAVEAAHAGRAPAGGARALDLYV